MTGEYSESGSAMFTKTAGLIGLLSVAVALGSPARVRAGSLYVEGTNSVLATLDPTTSTVTEIGTTSERLGGLGFGSNGTLYGLGDNGDLYVVNTATAALTLIGATGLNLSVGYSMGTTSDHTLYADGNGVVYTINPTTAAPTLVGNLGFTTTAEINGDASGHLYIINNSNESLYSVSRTTGAGSLIGAGTYGDIDGMAFTNGTMYAMQRFGTGIYALDLSNGSGTLVANYSTSIIGNVYAASGSFQAIPEPSSLALLGIGTLVVSGCWFARSRYPATRGCLAN